MGVRKLYGTAGSPATMRALASLYEHKLEFEFISIDLTSGEHKEPFLSLNPFGQVPAYQDEDLTLFESRTIMRFIFHNYYNPDAEHVYELPKLQGTAAGWIDIEDHHFNPSASKLTWEFIFKAKFIGGDPDAAIIAEEETKLAKILDKYEKRLAETKYLGGNKFTAADLTHLPYLYYLSKTAVARLFDERVFVKAWKESIMAREGWKKVVEMVEGVQA